MKVGVLGYGSIGKRHFRNAKELGHEVEFYDPLPSTGVMPSRELLLEWADAIIICTPSNKHALDITDALTYGQHVLCEKPFGYDCPELLDGLITGARDRGIVATGFNLRFHHCVMKARELIPELGDINFASFTVNQKTEKPVYLRDGILRNWCSHELDLANHLLGPGGTVINCTVSGDDGKDTTDAVITLKYPSVSGHVFIQADYYSDPEQRHFFIDGSKAMVGVDLIKRSVFMHDKKPDKRWQVLAATDSFDQNYIDEMKCFLGSIRAGTHCPPLATAEDGIAALYQVMGAREKAGLE